jgi:hypothetical protein
MTRRKIKTMMNKKNAKKGQGVVEYAGALVIAAVIVATVLATGPAGMGTMFNGVITTISNYFNGLTITAPTGGTGGGTTGGGTTGG